MVEKATLRLRFSSLLFWPVQLVSGCGSRKLEIPKHFSSRASLCLSLDLQCGSVLIGCFYRKAENN